MKNNIEYFLKFFIFFIFIFLSYFQAINQSFGYITDQDWTIIYNSLLVISGFEQEYFDHPAYTTFLIYGFILKVINLFFDLELNVLEILDTESPGENLQNIFTILRISNSIIIFLIFFWLIKILKIFEISVVKKVYILLTFLFFDSFYQSLFLLRSEALSLLFFLISNYFFLLYFKINYSNKYIILGSIFFTFSILTKTQTILLFLAIPFLINFIKEKFNYKNKIEFKNKSQEKIIYFFGFFVLLFSFLLYYKYPAPTDLTFFLIYSFVYILFINLNEKINFQKLVNIINFALIFVLGIFFSFLIIIFLDILKLIPFDYSIIPNNFSRPITHMSSFTGYDISKNNTIEIIGKITSGLYSLNNIKLLFGKNFLFIFLIFLIYVLFKEKFSKKKLFFYIIIFLNYMILSSIFLIFRDQYIYQIYLVPIFLIILIELAQNLPKGLFAIIVMTFVILNFNQVKNKINYYFVGDMDSINLCGYNETDWNMVNSNLKNYKKFQSLFCS